MCRLPQLQHCSFHFGLGIVFSWFVIAALPVVISNEGLPHALRSILILPPAIILSALGASAAYNYSKKHIRWPLRRALITLFVILLVSDAYYSYFIAWAKNPNTYDAFSSSYLELGRTLNGLGARIPKYVVVNVLGVLVNGIPMPAQTVMFITDTYTPEKQRAKNIYYVLPENENSIPVGALKFYLQ